jgi:outer membrane receptor protein involved in Fe transport
MQYMPAAVHQSRSRASMTARRACPLAACIPLLLVMPATAPAQTANPPPDQTPAGTSPPVAPDITLTLPPVDVVSSRVDLLGTATTASQGTVTKQEIDLRPAYRAGQVLETVPGLVVTVHSGEGKANQFFIRGFNLDHGTDFATYVDDMPVNEATHAHGQGYTDIHFLMPELAAGLDYTKGPFFANIGDFGALGSAHVRLVSEIPDQISVSAGTLRDDSVFMGGTLHLENGDRLLGALSVGHLDGPWSPPNDYNSFNATARYTHGDQNDGFDLTGMAYRGVGNFVTDQPVSAYQQGLIGRFGTLDPSDGGYAERFSLSGHYYVSGDDWKLTTSAYLISSRLTLWNDFTHFLVDPVRGDQEQQDETRFTAGGQVVYQRFDTIAGFATETDFGLMGRHDNEYIDRRHDQYRIVLPDCPDSPFGGGFFVCNADLVSLGDVGIWVSNTTHWTSWFRTIIGLREELYSGQDHSQVTGFTGSTGQAMLQPKASLVFGPWEKTELYISAGQGLHSNDLRGVLGTVPALGVTNPNQGTPLLTRITSEEVGIRSNFIPRTSLTAAVFREDFDSFLTYDADNGVDNAGPPARLQGIELSAQVRPYDWIELNADVNFTNSRYNTSDPAAYGVPGLFIPNAPSFIGSFGVIVDNLGPWFGGAQLRWLGPYPLLADNSLRSPGYKEVNLEVGYKINERLRIRLSIFNLFNTTAAASQYAYQYQVSPGAAPQFGATYHPLEPLSARLTLTVLF